MLLGLVASAAAVSLYLRYDERRTVAGAAERLEALAAMRAFHELPPGAVLLDDTFELCVDSSDPQVRRTMTAPDPSAAASFLRDLLEAEGWTAMPTSLEGPLLVMEDKIGGWEATVVLNYADGPLTLSGSVGNGDYEPGCLR